MAETSYSWPPGVISTYRFAPPELSWTSWIGEAPFLSLGKACRYWTLSPKEPRGTHVSASSLLVLYPESLVAAGSRMLVGRNSSFNGSWIKPGSVSSSNNCKLPRRPRSPCASRSAGSLCRWQGLTSSLECTCVARSCPWFVACRDLGEATGAGKCIRRLSSASGARLGLSTFALRKPANSCARPILRSRDGRVRVCWR